MNKIIYLGPHVVIRFLEFVFITEGGNSPLIMKIGRVYTSCPNLLNKLIPNLEYYFNSYHIRIELLEYR